MSGPILLAILGTVLFMLWKYSEHVKKFGAVVSQTAKAVGGAAATAAPPTDAVRRARVAKLAWTVALALAIVAVFYWELHTPGLRFSQVGDWSWNHWLWLLLFWGLIIALIAVNAKVLGTWATTLQSALAVVMFIMFLGVPVVVWIGEIVKPAEKRVLTLTAPPNGDSPHISGPNGHIVSFTGSGFVMHCVYSDGRDETYPCSSGIGLIKQYVHDVSGKQNTVVYEFVLPR